MDKVRAVVARLDQRFDFLLATHQAKFTSVVLWNERFCWFIVICDVVFGAILVLLLLRLRRHEQMLHVCAWSKAVEYEGEWITFEQYLTRRFGVKMTHGISPIEAEKLTTQLTKVRRD